MDLNALKNELLNDPNHYGYAAKVAVGSCGELADMLNQIRSNITVGRSNVTPMEILEAINVGDFVSSSNMLMGSWFESLTQFPSISILKVDGVTETRIMTNLMAILKNGTASETRIRALATRKGSRAEQLFGIQVADYDVAQALAL